MFLSLCLELVPCSSPRGVVLSISGCRTGEDPIWLALALRFRHRKKDTQAVMRNTIAATPPPMPALAPSEMPLLTVSVDVAEGEEAAVGEGVAELGSTVALVEKSDRSRCRNSTVIGWPHIVTGPVITFMFRSAWALRAGTVVVDPEL